MRHTGYTVSILKNTNKVIGHSDADFSSIRPNTMIRFGDDHAHYTVDRNEDLHFIYDFQTLDALTISIPENTDVNLGVGDTLYITFKEYTVSNFDILEKGVNFYADEILTLNDGNLVTENYTGLISPAKFKVKTINSDGSIDSLELLEGGKYFSLPDSAELKTKNGLGLKINIKQSISPERQTCEKVVRKVERKANQTIVYLTYPLPSNTKEGKLSVEKMVMFLTTNYSGDTKIDSNYELLRDLTPHLGLPLSIKNNPNTELVYNIAFHKIDEHIKKLENRVKELEDKLSRLNSLIK